MNAETKTGTRITLELGKDEAEQLLKELGQGTYCRGSACTRLWGTLEPAVLRAREAERPGKAEPGRPEQPAVQEWYEPRY